jgi:hypothetical protein
MPTPAEIEAQKRAAKERRMTAAEKLATSFDRYMGGTATRPDSVRVEDAYPLLRPKTPDAPRTLLASERPAARIATQGYLPDDPQRDMGLIWPGSVQATMDSTAAGLKKPQDETRPSAALADSIAAKEMLVLQKGGLEALRDSRRAPSTPTAPKTESNASASERLSKRAIANETDIAEQPQSKKGQADDSTVAGLRRSAEAARDSLSLIDRAEKMGYTNFYGGPGSFITDKTAYEKTLVEYNKVLKERGAIAAQQFLSGESGGNLDIAGLINMVKQFRGR